MNKRIVCLLLAIILSALGGVVLSGCGSKGGSDRADNGSDNSGSDGIVEEDTIQRSKTDPSDEVKTQTLSMIFFEPEYWYVVEKDSFYEKGQEADCVFILEVGSSESFYPCIQKVYGDSCLHRDSRSHQLYTLGEIAQMSDDEIAGKLSEYAANGPYVYVPYEEDNVHFDLYLNGQEQVVIEEFPFFNYCPEGDWHMKNWVHIYDIINDPYPIYDASFVGFQGSLYPEEEDGFDIVLVRKLKKREQITFQLDKEENADRLVRYADEYEEDDEYYED